MADELQNKAKIRFKFRSGEEFEAEGNPDFIEKQRTDFLQLIGKDSTHSTPSRRSILQAAVQTGNDASSNPIPSEHLYSTETPTIQAIHPRQMEGGIPSTPTNYPTRTATAQPVPPPNTEEPAFSRRVTPQHPAAVSGYIDRWEPPPPMSTEYPAYSRTHSKSPSASPTEIQLWENLIRTDDKLVYLRRKSRQLSPNTAALVLLAAAKVLLDASDGYSALLLSKALKKSGYGGDRLDRVIAGEMRQGLVRSDGSKRSRLYLLSDEGFARAYVLASKLAEEWHI